MAKGDKEIMRKSGDDISSILLEERVFPPPRRFAARARLKAKDVAELRRWAAADPIAFWADLARRELVLARAVHGDAR